MGMVKNCDNCIYSGRPSYDYPCNVCETAYGSAPSKWEGVVSATADMVEVVRCKDCIHYEHGKGYAPWCNHMCGLDEMGEDDFCSYGERKDNG